MISRIDDRIPRDGEPVSKAALRASFGVAKAELNHGGFFQPASDDALSRRVEDRLNDVFSVRDFGAVGDGVADDAEAVKAAMNAATLYRATLFFPRGTYDLTSWQSYRPPGDLFLRGEPGTVIRGPKDQIEALLVDNVDIDMADLTWEAFALLVRFYPHDRKLTECKLRNCRFVNVAKTLFSSGNIGGGLSLLHVEGCLFDGYHRAIQLLSGEVSQAIVTQCRFLSGGADAFFVGSNEEIGRVDKRNFLITGNIFESATSSDDEGHYIRCYGSYALIANNVFANLNSTAVRPNDVEAVYPKCRYTVISGNIFLNAGVGRGFISLKGASEHTVISQNEFRATQDHLDRYPDQDVTAIFIDSPTNVSIQGNQFHGFRDHAVQTGSRNKRQLKVQNNSFYDCPCDAIIDLVGTADIDISGNSVFDEKGNVPDIFVVVGDSGDEPSVVRIDGNDVHTTGPVVLGKAKNGLAHVIDISGNHIRGCSHLFIKAAATELGQFRCVDNRIHYIAEDWWHSGSKTAFATRMEIRGNEWPPLRTEGAVKRLAGIIPLPEERLTRVQWSAIAHQIDGDARCYYFLERVYLRRQGPSEQVGQDLQQLAEGTDTEIGRVALETSGPTILANVQGSDDVILEWSCHLDLRV
ncbi:MAG: glycosyl hydrolase family 28-related protein [Geminicoccaceae bacterium]